MANFHVGTNLIEDDEDDEVGTKERRISLQKKRHYKKDSRFLYDLYTLTFDENETVDEIGQVSHQLFDHSELEKAKFKRHKSSTRPNSELYYSAEYSTEFARGHKSLR